MQYVHTNKVILSTNTKYFEHKGKVHNHHTLLSLYECAKNDAKTSIIIYIYIYITK